MKPLFWPWLGIGIRRFFDNCEFLGKAMVAFSAGEIGRGAIICRARRRMRYLLLGLYGGLV